MARKKFGDVVVLLPGNHGQRAGQGRQGRLGGVAGAALQALLTLGHSLQDLRLDGDDPTSPTSVTG